MRKHFPTRSPKQKGENLMEPKEKYPRFTPDPEACKLVAEAFEDIKKNYPRPHHECVESGVLHCKEVF